MLELDIFNKRLLEEVFGTSIGCIAVVGNGPVDPVDKSIIEGADVVMRFNNWGSRTDGWCQDNLEKVGGRCDIMLGNFDIHTTNIGQRDITAPKIATLAIPTPHNIDRASHFERFYPDARASMVNPFWVYQCCQELGLASVGHEHPMPTVGMTGLYHLHHMKLDTVFFVTGFSWHYDRKEDTVQGIDIGAENLPTYWNHFYIKELVWVSRNLLDDPRWSFGPQAEEALQRVYGKRFPWE